MKEQAFRYGESNRGVGMAALPSRMGDAPVVIMLNAGLLHRAEPYRLNVLTCRLLAEIGYLCIRVDISGKGDTPSRKGLINRDSVALDWHYIKKSVLNQFGERNLVIMGLCSGADNGIKIAAEDTSVKGLILLDAISKKDSGFNRRTALNNITNVNYLLNLPYRAVNKAYRIVNPGNVQRQQHPIDLRDAPTDHDMQQCFRNMVSLNGRILAVFTSHALNHYNQKGQFARAMGIDGLDEICEEIFWPHTMHLYPVQTHRDQLLHAIGDWCTRHYDRLQTKGFL